MKAQTWLGLCALSLALTACSAILDTDKKQCKADIDCGELNGKPLYSCEKNFCKQVACSADAECRAIGDLVCESQTCVRALCLEDNECTVAGEVCREGRCLDPQFYCFDEMPPLTSTEGPLLKFTLVNAFDQSRVENLQIRVCATLDVTCNSPIASSFDYDPANNEVTVHGLENGRTYSLRFNGTDIAGNPFIETDYVMQRPVVGVTQEAEPFGLVYPGLVDTLSEASSEMYDPTKGIVLAQLFGCDNKPLAGVTATDNRSGTLFYLSRSTADANATETDVSGQVGFVNMETGEGGTPRLHTLTFTHGGAPFYSFSVSPRAGVLTYLYMYLPDYGTTANRAGTIVP